jgi:chromosome partitioning protein
VSTVVFGNQKGGPGKSTLSVLYAQWLVDRLGLRVCLVDLDSQRNASKALQRHACGLQSAALFRDPPLSWTECAGLQLVEGSRSLIELERERPEAVIPAFRAQLRALSAAFDCCVIDTPPVLGLRLSAALIATNHVVCPIELEAFCLDGVTDMLRTVFGVRQRYNPALQLPVLLVNRFNGHSVRQKQALVDLMTRYAEYVLPGKVSTRSAIPEALATGELLWRMGKTSARDAAAELEPLFSHLQQRLTPRASEKETV